MAESKADAKRAENLSRIPEPIRQALKDKLQAIAGYDAILWKIRTGYLLVLYGALGLTLGTGGLGEVGDLANNPARSMTVLSLIWAFSVAAFLVDFGYIRKKLKVIVARDELVKLWIRQEHDQMEKLQFLLRISGEAELPAGDLFPGARRQYRKQRNWNLFWITLWLYFITPVIATVLIFSVIRA
jgi:hypothetical protein